MESAAGGRQGGMCSAKLGQGHCGCTSLYLDDALILVPVMLEAPVSRLLPKHHHQRLALPGCYSRRAGHISHRFAFRSTFLPSTAQLHPRLVQGLFRRRHHHLAVGPRPPLSLRRKLPEP